MAIASAGSLITAQDKTAGATTWGPTVTTAAIAGEVCRLRFATDNESASDGETNEHLSVTDSAGNTWTKIKEWCASGAGADAGVTLSVWASKLTSDLSTSDTITLTMSTNTVAAKAVSGWRWTVDSGNTLQLAGTIQTSATNGTPVVSQAISGLASKEYLFDRASGQERNDTTWTATAGYTAYGHSASTTTGGGAATNVGARGEFVIATATGHTSDPTHALGGAVEQADLFMAWEEVAPPAGGAGSRLPLLGVGS